MSIFSFFSFTIQTARTLVNWVKDNSLTLLPQDVTAYSTPPDRLAEFKGPTSNGKGEEGKVRERREGKGKKEEERKGREKEGTQHSLTP